MKLIITEQQLRTLIENEDKGENLMDLTGIYESGISPNKWDSMFEHMTKKKGGVYDGYYIDDKLIMNEYDITELKYLVKVSGNFDLSFTPIESLPKLESVGGGLYLNNSQIKSLPKLESVGKSLRLSFTSIKELPMLSYVGGDLYLKSTPLSKTTTEEELRNKIEVKGNIYL